LDFRGKPLVEVDDSDVQDEGVLQDRVERRSPLASLVSGDDFAIHSSYQESHFRLGKSGALAVRPQICAKWLVLHVWRIVPIEHQGAERSRMAGTGHKPAIRYYFYSITFLDGVNRTNGV